MRKRLCLKVDGKLYAESYDLESLLSVVTDLMLENPHKKLEVTYEDQNENPYQELS